MKKAVLVTGAEVGHTGYAIAAKFAWKGYTPIITCLTETSAAEAAKKLNDDYDAAALGFPLDLRNGAQAEALFDALDAQDLLVETLCLNAADLALGPDPARGTPFFEVTPAYMEQILAANVVGNFRLAQLAAERMRVHGRGAIVFIGSNSAARPNKNRVPYVTSKGGIQALSKGLAVDLGPYGIRSNVILPGTIKTARWVGMGDKQISNGTMVPLGDISDFEDIANAAYFLGSDEAKNITGAELTVDGGMTAQLYPEILNRYRAEEIERKAGEAKK